MFSLQDLSRWEGQGALWRLVRSDGGEPLLELCTCYGETVDVVRPARDLLDKLTTGELLPPEARDAPPPGAG